MFISREFEKNSYSLFFEFTPLDLCEINYLEKLQKENRQPEIIDLNCILGSYKGMTFFELFNEKIDILRVAYQLLLTKI